MKYLFILVKISANKIYFMCLSEAEKLTWTKRINDNIAAIKKEANHVEKVSQKNPIVLRNEF
jgi:hypothetical protein